MVTKSHKKSAVGRKKRVNVFLYEDDVRIIWKRAAADEIPWTVWFRKFVRKALATSDAKGRIV